MAEKETTGEKGFAKIFTRRMARTKEKVMQTVGKADKTTDSDFDRVVESYIEQQTVASHLIKEFKNYTVQVKAMSLAGQNMYQAIRDSYESTWKNSDKFVPATENLVSLWDDYLEKLNDSVLPLLTNYVNKFKDVKGKVAKRGRKLTDYDCARHNVDSLENAKKRDEGKITRANEELIAAKLVYESIHSELSEELPALYQSRVPSLSSYFGALFEAEAMFESESAKIKTSLAGLVDAGDAAFEISSQVSHPRPRDVEVFAAEIPTKSQAPVPSHVSPPRPPIMHRNISGPEKRNVVSEAGDEQHDYITLLTGADRIDSENSDVEDDRTDRVSQVPATRVVNAGGSARTDNLHISDVKNSSDRETDQVAKAKLFSSSNSSIDSVPRSLQRVDGRLESPLLSSEGSIGSKDKKTNEEGKSEGGGEAFHEENGKHSNEATEVKLSEDVGDRDLSSSDEEVAAATVPVAEKAHNYLFQVAAIHMYRAEDSDELSFEKGDIIGILPSVENSEEQDEGWLYGVKCSTGEKGVFPLNFTSRL